MSHRTFNDPHGITDIARQGLLDNRCEHGPKRHRTKARKKRISKAKRERTKRRIEAKNAVMRKFHAAVRSYWRGEGDHP